VLGAGHIQRVAEVTALVGPYHSSTIGVNAGIGKASSCWTCRTRTYPVTRTMWPCINRVYRDSNMCTLSLPAMMGESGVEC
jgi:hypothetical protein